MKFEIVSKYADRGLNLPVRKTKASAGYDFQVAEDTIIPSYSDLFNELVTAEITSEFCDDEVFTLDKMAALTKYTHCKPTLVPTGIKCEIPEGFYLELSVRSSCPLKHWLILANGVGVIDADYYNNIDNEGAIYFQIINLSPFPILLKKGDAIGQGILKKYYITDDDAAQGERIGGFGSTDSDEARQLTLQEWMEIAPEMLAESTEECAMTCDFNNHAFIVGAPKTINEENGCSYE